MLRRAALLADATKGAHALQRYLHDVLAPAAAAEGACMQRSYSIFLSYTLISS
jgi:hypothetical protein